MIVRPLVIAAGCVMMALVACDAQTSEEYLGEPLAIVRGDVLVSTENAPQMDVVLVWNEWESEVVHGRGAIPQELGHGVAITFPGRFEVKLFTPPPESALSAWQTEGHHHSVSRMGIASIVAVAQGEQPGAGGHHQASLQPLGVVDKYVMVYAGEESLESSTEGSYFGDYYSEHLAPGYHLMEVADTECPNGAERCLLPAVGGMDTLVELVISDDAEFPSWN